MLFGNQVQTWKYGWPMGIGTKKNTCLCRCHCVLQVILQSNSVELSGVGQLARWKSEFEQHAKVKLYFCSNKVPIFSKVRHTIGLFVFSIWLLVIGWPNEKNRRHETKRFLVDYEIIYCSSHTPSFSECY